MITSFGAARSHPWDGGWGTYVKKDRVEKAIADDRAFLAAHPVRQSKKHTSEEVARRREFVRQRIKDIAASRDLSDAEIKPALTLRHHLIARFSEQHGVNIEWLLEGRGRIFKDDPIVLNPNMTGTEFAAVVHTLPIADQRAIEARVREIVEGQQP